jgi:hypothetical protein
MTRHTARASRTGLVIIGLILLLGAGAVLARSLNASTSVLGNPHAPLLTHGQVQYPTKNSWVWPVVAAASFLIAVLALWWMAAQTRIRAVRRMPLPGRQPACLARGISGVSPPECRLPAGLTLRDGIGIEDSGCAPGACARGLDHWSSEPGAAPAGRDGAAPGRMPPHGGRMGRF